MRRLQCPLLLLVLSLIAMPLAGAEQARLQISVTVLIDPGTVRVDRWQTAFDGSDSQPESEGVIPRNPPPGFRLLQPDGEGVLPVIVLEPEI